MIKIVKGDLMKATENIIGHQVNCRGVFNSGVAKVVRETYPIAFEKYKDFIKASKAITTINLLGEVQFVKCGEQKFIANIFGQDNFGYDGEQYTSTKSLHKGLNHLRMMAEKYEHSVALPYLLGSDRGGANWREVESIILDAFDGYEVTLYKL